MRFPTGRECIKYSSPFNVRLLTMYTAAFWFAFKYLGNLVTMNLNIFGYSDEASFLELYNLNSDPQLVFSHGWF